LKSAVFQGSQTIRGATSLLLSPSRVTHLLITARGLLFPFWLCFKQFSDITDIDDHGTCVFPLSRFESGSSNSRLLLDATNPRTLAQRERNCRVAAAAVEALRHPEHQRATIKPSRLLCCQGGSPFVQDGTILGLWTTSAVAARAQIGPNWHVCVH
jgi:hypothetical protein